MKIFVDNEYGKNFTVRLGAWDRLRDLKAKIKAKTGQRSSYEMVFYGGTRMRMNWRLSAYGLRDGCTVHLGPLGSVWRVGRGRSRGAALAAAAAAASSGGTGGGGGGGISGGAGCGGGSPICFVTFVDLENKDALQRIPINYGTGRRCTEVSRGLNIEGTCTSMSCEAFGRRVISPIHFHPFDITTDKARCPMCSCTVEATTCGFVNCQWIFTGRRKGSDADIMSEWYLAGDEYVRFREAGNMVDWEVLIISAIHSQSGLECDLCLCVMRYSDEKDRLACGCRFHSNCVAQWNERETGCPNCSREESTSHSLLEVIENKLKTRRGFWRLCQI